MSLLAAVLRLGEVCSQGAARPASQKHEGLKLDSLGAGEPEVLPRQYRSCGAAHAKFVKLGIQKSKLKKIAEVTQIHQDERINLVRAVFGQFQHKVIVVADDTSIWVNHSTEKVELTEEGSISKEQQSMKRTCPLLGMLQQLAVKRSGDSLPANFVCQAEELMQWRQLIQENDANARSTFHIGFSCLHHSACLSKKPALLSVDGVCSNFVRLTRAMKSTRFQERFSTAVDTLANKLVRRTVPCVPPMVQEWLDEFQNFRSMALAGIPRGDQSVCLQIFNNIWFQDGVVNDCSFAHTWCHWCGPGCCSDEIEFRARAKQALRALLQVFPDVPLLYRWKHFEPCLQYVIRGSMCHRVLQYCLLACSSPDNQAKLEALDQDSPDLSFSVKQEVRLSKAIAMLTSENFQAKMGILFLVSAPLATFMDEVSLCETARNRFILLEKGLSLSSSRCTVSADKIQLMNWELVSGAKSANVISDYSSILTAPPSSDITKPFAMSLADYFTPVLATMCDAYLRLKCPSQRSQVQILGIHFMPVNEAADKLREIQQLPKCCSGDACTQARLSLLSFGN
ncbi:HMG box domain-containing protein [Durusdinium trenchii]|uniref:HMG box domain-containing protein n=1 Tax=Durusdinium trenchii TaxID=1381693 RepID=A0ABP0JBD0_9DINO